MKTMMTSTSLKNTFQQIIMTLFTSMVFLSGLHSQGKRIFDHDFLMPQKGKSMVEFYSGIPYVAIGQYGYGISNRFSLGLFYGHTPFEKGYGLRMKAIVGKSSENFRMNIKSPFIYYPGMKSKGGEPWVLAWPTFNGEWKFKNGSRIWTGVGVIGAACVEYLFKPGGHGSEHEGEHGEHGEHEHHHDPQHEPPTGGDMPPKEGEDMFSVFNTFQFGYSKPFSNQLSFIAEIAPVMEGFKLKSPSGFLDTTPFVVTVGLSCSF
jgi:hypothetical protein